jgi:hypothetical protein
MWWLDAAAFRNWQCPEPRTCTCRNRMSLRSGHLELSSNKTRHFHTTGISWGITSITRCLADGSAWGEPTAWPPRSPDLTSMDFYLWGCIKNQVQRAKNYDLQQSKALITDDGVMEPTKHVSKHVDRGRIRSGYLSCQHWKLPSTVRITHETSYFLQPQIAGLYNGQVSRYLLDNYHPETLHDPSYYSRWILTTVT